MESNIYQWKQSHVCKNSFGNIESRRMVKGSIKLTAPRSPCGPFSGSTPERGSCVKQSGRRRSMSVPGLGCFPFEMSAAK